MKVGEFYDCLEVDFNRPMDALLARDPHWRDRRVGTLVFAYCETDDEQDRFGCLARVLKIMTPEELHRTENEPMPDYGLLVLSRR